ncbi:MAG TPA: asparagine synthase-related protein [Solirubrobacterales bacterium]
MPASGTATGNPAVCGALGEFDPERLELMRKAFGALDLPLEFVHRDDSSALLLDREPVSWSGRRATGLGWSEGLAAGDQVSSWKEAAQQLACCGLVIEGASRYVHSSVSGVAPVYYMQDGEATYFASRIDPLVSSAPPGRRLTIDWEAWAGIFLMTAPLGDRTPFLEVRRLPPFSTLKHWPGKGPRRRSPAWPWAEVTLDRDASSGEGLIAELREAIAEVPAGPLVCPLSGGWDSRLLLMLASERKDLRLSAWTLKSTHRGSDETPYARKVAKALGVPVTQIPRGRSYWGDQEKVALRCDYQTTHHGWFMPLARRLRDGSHSLVDGLAGGIFVKGHFVTEGMLQIKTRRERLALLWEYLSNAPSSSEVLSERLSRVMTKLALRAWEREARALAGSPAQLSLTAYMTRTLRGISLAPTSILGAEATVLTPFTDDRVARAALAVPPESKLDGALYREIFSSVNPKVGSLPSTNDAAETPEQPTGNREIKKGALEGFAERLRHSPLRDEVDPAVLDSNKRLERILDSSKSAHLVRALSLMAMWEERYRDRLAEINPKEIAP